MTTKILQKPIWLQKSIFANPQKQNLTGRKALGIGFWVFYISIFSSFGFVYGDHFENDKFDEDQIELFSKPTFGLDHQTHEQIIDEGFKINGQSFEITDNFHTPFEEYRIEIGKLNSFEAVLYAPNGLKVQEFLFGIPNLGEAHLAEMRVEVWFDLEGKIKNYRVFQSSEVIDSQHIILKHEKTKCNELDNELLCDKTKIGLIFRESLKDRAIAIKAIDFENRFQITYLNEGVEVSGTSLNPNETQMIPSSSKNEGLIPVTQFEKYSSFWQSEDGKIFEKNNFGSFIQREIEFQRFQDKGEPRTRLHSGFSDIIQNEQKRALNVFNSTKIMSHLNESFTIEITISDTITDEVKEKMKQQETIAKEIMEKSNLQARF